MQPFACKLKAENRSRSGDSSTRMLLALGSSYFTWKDDDASARIILFPCKWGLSQFERVFYV